MKSEQKSTLFALRSRTLKKIKLNYPTFYKNNTQCQLCNSYEDTQEHCIVCPVILNKFGSDILNIGKAKSTHSPQQIQHGGPTDRHLHL